MTDDESPPEFTPPTQDPWKGLRGVMAGTLILEVIVVLLALPVVAKLGGGITWLSGGYIGLLTLLMALGAGLQRRPWAVPYNMGLQIAFIAGWFAHPSIGWLGLLFLVVWGFILYLRRDISFRLERGLLPGQRE